MRKPRGGQILANRVIGPREVLGGGDRRVPAKGKRSYRAAQRSLRSLVDLVHSPAHRRERGGVPFGLRPYSVPLAF